MSIIDVKSNKGQGIPELKPRQPSKQSVTRSAGLMSLGTLVSRVLGFVRDRLVVQYFDVQVADAFYAAYRLPNFFRILLGEGALSVSFLPAYVDLQRKNDKSEDLLAGTVWMFLSILSSTISALAVVYMDQLLPFIVDTERFQLIPNKYEMTLFFSQIMFSYLFLVSQYAFFMSILNSHDEFFYPGLAPAVYNFLVISIILINPSFFNVLGESLPLSVIVGGVGQALLVFAKSYKMRIVPKPNFLFFRPDFLNVLRRAAPSMVGIGAIQFLGVINLGFASSLDAGSITFLYLADRLLELPQSILAISLGAALLPRLTSFWAHEEKDNFLNQMYETISMYYFLAIPSAIGLVLLAEPMVTLLFATKNLTIENIQTTASIVKVYSIMLLIGGTSKLVLQGFYAVKNTLYPAVGSCLVIGIHFFLAPVLMGQWGLVGLVVSTTSASLVALILTFICFHLLVTPLSLTKFFNPIPSVILLNISTAIISYLTLVFWKAEASMILKNIYLLIGICSSVICYFYLAKKFKFEQAEIFLKIFKRFG